MKDRNRMYPRLLLVAIVIICIGLSWGVKRYFEFEKYKRLKGDIIELKINKLDNVLDQEKIYYPKIRYSDDAGVVHEFELKVGYKRPPWKIGDKIDLLMNQEKPTEVLVDTFMYKWFGPMILTVVGVGIMVVAVFVSRHARRRGGGQEKT